MSELPPPSVVFPDLKVSDSRNQGLVETYIFLNWLPYWESLTPPEQAQYLDRWQVSEEWRHDIAECYGPQQFDAEEAARESEAYLAEWRKRQAKPSLKEKLARLFGS